MNDSADLHKEPIQVMCYQVTRSRCGDVCCLATLLWIPTSNILNRKKVKGLKNPRALNIIRNRTHWFQLMLMLPFQQNPLRCVQDVLLQRELIISKQSVMKQTEGGRKCRFEVYRKAGKQMQNVKQNLNPKTREQTGDRQTTITGQSPKMQGPRNQNWIKTRTAIGTLKLGKVRQEYSERLFCSGVEFSVCL